MPKPTRTHSYRIGAMSKLAGIPVPTLRVWESRYGAFSPVKTDGQHRMYAEEDLLRATLLKQLCDAGHTISTIANLDAQALHQLHRKHQSAHALNVQSPTSRSLTVAVVGLGLAGRIESKKFALNFQEKSLQVVDIFDDLETAKIDTLARPVEILLIKANTLHEIVMQDIDHITSKNSIAQVIVLYNFGRDPVAQAMRKAGMLVRREPISDYELAELMQNVMWVGTPQTLVQSDTSTTIPARKYSDQTLARVAAISTNVLCECPSHIAEIISQLTSFEQYSQECLNTSIDDAQFHAYLASVSGSARALFEQALERVAQHEGIEL